MAGKGNSGGAVQNGTASAGEESSEKTAGSRGVLDTSPEAVERVAAELEAWARHDDYHGHAKRAAALLRALVGERERYSLAILWALGEHEDFSADEPPRVAGRWRRRYYWREELRQRAGPLPPPPATLQTETGGKR